MTNANQIFQGVCKCGATMIDMRKTECVACKTAREAEEAQERRELEAETAALEARAKVEDHEAAIWDAYNDALLDEPDLDIDTFRARWEEQQKK